MNAQPVKTPETIVIQLEVISEDEQQPDIADIEEISREIVDYLRSNGYEVEPGYSGTKGIPGFEIVMDIYSSIHSHEALVAAALSFASSSLQCIIKVCDWRVQKEKKLRQTPYEVSLEVNGKSLTITAPDVESATKLVERFQQIHPEKVKQLSQGSMKIKVRVPKKQRRLKG